MTLGEGEILVDCDQVKYKCRKLSNLIGKGSLWAIIQDFDFKELCAADICQNELKDTSFTHLQITERFPWCQALFAK